MTVSTQDPSTHAWKPLSRLFSGPDWLPLGLRGWQSVWNVSKLGDRLHDEFQRGLPSWGFSHQFATSFSRAWKMKCSAIFVPEENTRDKEIYFSVLKKGNYRHSFRTLIVDWKSSLAFIFAFLIILESQNEIMRSWRNWNSFRLPISVSWRGGNLSRSFTARSSISSFFSVLHHPHVVLFFSFSH